MIAGPALVEQAGARLGVEGGARPRRHPLDQRRRRRCRRHRGRGLRPGARLPLLPAVERRRAATGRAVRRSRRSPRAAPRRHRAAQPAPVVRHAGDRDARSSTPARSSRSGERGARRSSAASPALAGIPVAVYAENPMMLGGGWTADSCRKLIRLIDVASLFKLPIVHLEDCPGFLIGIEAERTCTVRFGSEVLVALRQAQVPYCTVVIRKAFGIAGASNRKPGTESMRMAWPSGDWGSLPLEGGLEVAYKAELAASDDPAGAPRRDRRAPQPVALAAPLGRVLRDRADHRPARHAPDAVRLGAVGAPHAGARAAGVGLPAVTLPAMPTALADRTAEGRVALPPRRLDVGRHRAGPDRTPRRRSDADLARRLPRGVLVRRFPSFARAVLVRPLVAADRRRPRHRHRRPGGARWPARTCAMPSSRRPRSPTSAATTVVPACRGASTARARRGTPQAAARRRRDRLGRSTSRATSRLPEQTVTIDYLESAVTPAGLVAIGLGGYEVGFPAAPYAPHFERARAIGLHSVPHAGETEGADSVRQAVELLQCRAHRSRCALPSRIRRWSS